MSSELRPVQLICTTLLRRGKGVADDPIRCIEQWWDLQGNLLFEYDPCDDEHKGYMRRFDRTDY